MGISLSQFYETPTIAGENPRQFGSFLQALRATSVLVAVFGAISLILFFLNTRQGIGVLPDTTRYMGINDLPYDAPIYAWLFRAAGNFGIGLTATATAAAIVVLIMNVVLLATLLFRITERMIYVAAGSALVLLSPQFVTLHSLAMSEPLFLSFLLLTLHLSLTFLQTENRSWLVFSGVALGLATLTRFTAPPLGAALALAYLLNRQYPFAKRFADAGILFATSGTMFFAWIVANNLSGEQSIGRELSFFGTMGAKEWYTSFKAMAAWLLPDNVPDFIRLPVLIVIVGTCAFLAWKHGLRILRQSPAKKPGTELILVVLAFFFVFYVAFVFLASAIEANLHLNSRYGFPAYVALVMLAAGLASRYRARPGQSRALAVGFAALVVMVLAAHGARTAVRTYGAYKTGVGYNSLDWKLSPTIAGIHKLPADAIIYSNGADAVAYIVNEPSHFVPYERLLRTNLPDPSNPLPAQIAVMRKQAETQPVYVVYFDMVWWRPYLVDEEKLKADLGMELIESLPDGRIYKIPAKPESAQ